MTQVFQEDGEVERVTVLEAVPSRYRDPQRGARRVQRRAARLWPGQGEASLQARARPPEEGWYLRHKHLVEFRNEGAELQMGDTVTV